MIFYLLSATFPVPLHNSLLETILDWFKSWYNFSNSPSFILGDNNFNIFYIFFSFLFKIPYTAVSTSTISLQWLSCEGLVLLYFLKIEGNNPETVSISRHHEGGGQIDPQVFMVLEIATQNTRWRSNFHSLFISLTHSLMLSHHFPLKWLPNLKLTRFEVVDLEIENMTLFLTLKIFPFCL